MGLGTAPAKYYEMVNTWDSSSGVSTYEHVKTGLTTTPNLSRQPVPDLQQNEA
jgi:hypothetical protein